MPAKRRDYRRGRNGAVPTISVRTWIDARTLGRLALVACLIRVRSGGRPGIGEACALLMFKPFGKIVREATDAELEAAVLLLDSAFPVTRQAWTYGRESVRQRLGPRETPSIDNNPSESSRVG